MIHPAVAAHLDGIRALCYAWQVDRLELFGSAVTSQFDPDRSDVNFIVSFPPHDDAGELLTRMADFEADVEALLKRPVHLVMPSALKKARFAALANETRTLIYAAPAAGLDS